MTRGKALYFDNCTGCHIEDGAGIAQVFPPLKASAAVQAKDPATVLKAMIDGATVVATTEKPTGLAMPAFGWKLSDAELADLATYIRNAWGNRAGAGFGERRCEGAQRVTTVCRKVKPRLAGDAATGRRGSVRAILYSLGANMAIAAAKLVGATFTGSGSLLAEAFHSIADSGNEGLLLLGRKQAARRRQRAIHSAMAALLISGLSSSLLLLFSIGGVASIYEGVDKLRRVESLETPLVAVAIILFAVVAEAVSLYVALKEIDSSEEHEVFGAGSANRGAAS